jgi:RNA polymerase sigma factor (TIGR02999 family)
MSEVTRLVDAAAARDRQAAADLLPLVYNDLRALPAARMTAEAPGQTLQATALVHEAYLRLVDTDQAQPWDSRGHFFAAAAEAMRRILVEAARRKSRLKHGGGRIRESNDQPAASTLISCRSSFSSCGVLHGEPRSRFALGNHRCRRIVPR